MIRWGFGVEQVLILGEEYRRLPSLMSKRHLSIHVDLDLVSFRKQGVDGLLSPHRKEKLPLESAMSFELAAMMREIQRTWGFYIEFQSRMMKWFGVKFVKWGAARSMMPSPDLEPHSPRYRLYQATWLPAQPPFDKTKIENLKGYCPIAR